MAAHRFHAFSLLLPLVEGHCAASDERWVLFADREEQTETDVMAAVAAHRDRCHDAGNECRLLEAVFVDSHTCPGVQATDLAMYAHQRRESGLDTDPRARAALDGFAQMIAPFVRYAARHPPPAQWLDGATGSLRTHKEPHVGGSSAR